ncbi:MAG: 2Fe-2S iron-sulfur cluster binding domain-containing protein [Burkholderiales bacterium]|nr:2Fe-2S iron-sulfur cluster binding domain-containing protein [Burkholderiales bacterium]
MSRRVHLEPFGRAIEVDDGATILECALMEGIDYPFACQQGQCGSCKSLLLEGEVELGTLYNPLVLSPQERARGLILACQAQPKSDCTVAALAQDGRIVYPPRTLACRVREITTPLPGRSVVTLAVESGGPFGFVAGQCAKVSIAGAPARRLPIASPPQDETLEFHWMHESHAAPAWGAGTPASVELPMGDAVLHDEHLGPIIALADPAGLATMLSILRAAIRLELPQTMRLYILGGAALADWLQGDAALASASRRLRIFAAEDAATLVARAVTEHADLPACRAYLAGALSLIEAARAHFIERGLAPENFVAEEQSC